VVRGGVEPPTSRFSVDPTPTVCSPGKTQVAGERNRESYALYSHGASEASSSAPHVADADHCSADRRVVAQNSDSRSCATSSVDASSATLIAYWS
jgi:hypothetical protein